MLGKMLIQGLLAAALGSAAAVYAEMRTTAQAPAQHIQDQPQAQAGATQPDKAQADNGYLRPPATWLGKHDRKHDAGDRDRKHKRKHHHDDD